MKLVSYKSKASAGWGVLDQDGIAPMHHSCKDIRQALSEGTDSIKQKFRKVTERLSENSVVWMPPIPNPNKIFCVGINYKKHMEETSKKVGSYPSIFTRFSDSFVGHLQPVIRPRVSDMFDYEAELGVIIGKKGRYIKPYNALDYVSGYTCISENSIRDYQRHGGQVTPGKNFDNTGSIGPWIVTKDEVMDPEKLEVIGILNGVKMQHGFNSEYIFSVSEIISYISTFTTIFPGDVIAMGTPDGIGATRTPPVWLKPGDVFEVDIPLIGTLINTVGEEI